MKCSKKVPKSERRWEGEKKLKDKRMSEHRTWKAWRRKRHCPKWRERERGRGGNENNAPIMSLRTKWSRDEFRQEEWLSFLFSFCCSVLSHLLWRSGPDVRSCIIQCYKLTMMFFSRFLSYFLFLSIPSNSLYFGLLFELCSSTVHKKSLSFLWLYSCQEWEKERRKKVINE